MTTEALVPVTAEPAVVTAGGGEIVLPQVIVDAGPVAVARFLEFFAGQIANARTRVAYGRAVGAVGQFLGWCEARGLRLTDVSPLHVAAYIRTHPRSVPTVKQHLAAIRMLGDWLVVNQVLPVNPAAAVRILTNNHGVVYGTLASICASLLGFTITATSIVLVSASTPRLRILRNSRHYPVMWRVFRAAIRALALGTVLSLVALVVGRDRVLSDPVLFFLVFAVLLSCLRIARAIWVLENIIVIVAAHRGGEGD